MNITLSANIRRIQPNEKIPASALHSVDGITFMPIFNQEETVGKLASEFNRRFYVIESAVAEAFEDHI